MRKAISPLAVPAVVFFLSFPVLADSAPASRPAIVADFDSTVVEETRASTWKVIKYEHEMLKDWGYPDGSPKKPFVVCLPNEKAEHPPMIVYLHGAGGKAYTSLPTKMYGFGPEFVSLSLDCEGPKGPEGWYGLFWAQNDRQKYATTLAPPEQRYLAEIEWVVRKYGIDRNRIYLWGHSMGGSGTLGLGMARGDIFAAIWAGVPAGVDHVWMRMGFPPLLARPRTTQPTSGRAVGSTSQMVPGPDYLRRISGIGLPDAPPVINFSSQTDGWANNQENFIQACHDGRHLLVFCWAPFGHTQNYETANPIALAYPWLSIRKDQAYPVFTDATSDQKYPGLNNKEGDQHGQINVYFRWKAVTDEPAKFQMDLWLADSKVTTRPVSIPESSTADITPRRLQKFKVEAGKSYAWRVAEGDKVLQSGKARPDEVGLLTIPRVTITAQARTLTIEPEK